VNRTIRFLVARKEVVSCRRGIELHLPTDYSLASVSEPSGYPYGIQHLSPYRAKTFFLE
ncbi:hypothetical protein ALC60_12671, partial [Trachymyrmex zeteki]